MRKWLNNPWFVGPLACVAFALCAWSVLAPQHTGSAQAPTPEAVPEAGPLSSSADAPATVAQAAALDNIREVFPVGRKAADDAAATAPAPTDLSETFTLSAVWSQGSTVLAIINGRLCSAGDSIGSATIASVTSDGVWVDHIKGRRLLTLGRPLSLTIPGKAAPASTALATQL
ncbi:hypothetical protein [Nibricoccus sp. IMCC34717]|uniref:hypothetical protein n=1 Tax=Nibricoccus sp. IMCC34717 TaxID=3034021 RepID=UPI00384BF19B